MSGAEALAAISIIANIVALTTFSRDVVSQIKEYGENAHAVPKAFRDLQAVLPLISRTTTRTQEQIKSGNLDDEIYMILRPVLEGCENRLKQLEVIFKDVMVQEGASKLKRGWMVMKSMRKDREVKEIAKALDMFVGRLVEAMTTKDIESLKLTMSSMSVEQPEIRSPKTHFLVPVQWSDDFSGRGEVMAYLESKLCLEDQHSRVALVGLGGMGKTRIAIEYAKKFKKSSLFSVFWVYAGTVERFKNAYCDIARKLEIPGYQSPDSDILNLVKNWLENNWAGQWLMILDNADDAEIMYGSRSLRLADYLPRSDRGSILLTTRFQKVGANFTSPRNVYNLQSMTLVESESLLRARLDDNSLERDPGLYQELAEELEQTPLALVQAASYMYQNCMSVATYLQLYRQSDVSKIRLLSEDFQDDLRDSQAKNPIATTWIISFDYIRFYDPQAAELLSLMSIMDAQAIPDYLLPQGEDAISFNKAIGTLEAFYFISTRKQSHGSLQRYKFFDLHRLVRLAIRNWLKMGNTLDQKTAHALRILASRCFLEASMKFEISSLILPHAIEILASDLLNFKVSSSQHSELGNSDLPSVGDLRSSFTIFTGQCQDPGQSLGNADVIHTADLLDYVAFHFVTVGNHVQAKSFAVKSLIVTSRACGPSHIRTLFSMYTLASILQNS